MWLLYQCATVRRGGVSIVDGGGWWVVGGGLGMGEVGGREG